MLFQSHYAPFSKYSLLKVKIKKNVYIKSIQYQLILRILLARTVKTITEPLFHQGKDFFFSPLAKGVNQSKIEISKFMLAETIF